MARLLDPAVALAQLAALIAVAPLYAGALLSLRERLVGRGGLPLAQRYRELRARLLAATRHGRHGPAGGAQPRPALADGAAALALAATCAAAGLVPVVTVATAGTAGSAVAFVGLLALARAAEALGPLLSGDPLAARGAGRHAVAAALAEPCLLVALGAASLASGTGDFGRMALLTASATGLLLTPGLVLAGLALGVVVLVETGRAPRPGHEAATELTLHRGGAHLAAEGPRLALLTLTADVRALTLGTLLVNLFAPVGIAARNEPQALALAAAVIAVKLGALVLVLATLGAGLARARLLQFPEILGASFALGVLALVFVLARGRKPAVSTDEFALPLLDAVPPLVLVAALFSASVRRLESRLQLLRAARGALALLFASLGVAWARPVLLLAAVARLAAAETAVHALRKGGERPRLTDLPPTRKLLLLAGSGALAAVVYAGTARIGQRLAAGEVSFRAGAATAFLGLFAAATRSGWPVPALLVASDGVALALLAATGGDPEFTLLAVILDAALAAGATRISDPAGTARPRPGAPAHPAGEAGGDPGPHPAGEAGGDPGPHPAGIAGGDPGPATVTGWGERDATGERP